MIQKQEKFKYIGSVYLLLIKDDKIVLLKRQNTGYEDGNYGLIAGHMDGGESPTQAMVREAKEEAGIDIQPEHLRCVHTMHRRLEDERIDFFFITDKWQGEIQNMEPEKCSHVDWFRLDDLPSNTIDYIYKAIQYYINGVHYSEYGW